MHFCPKCGTILLPEKENNKTRMICNSCKYKSKTSSSIIIKEKIKLNKEDKIEIIENRIETMPKTNVKCPKCENPKAYYWTVQTRAGDEAETRFFECVKCKHRWRSYD